jgi:hypothetical protein
MVDKGSDVKQTADGGYIIVGYTNSFGAGEYDVYLVKTDSDGQQEWFRTYGGTENEYGYSVQQTSDRGYIIVGSTVTFAGGNIGIYLIKTDSLGNQSWFQTYGGGYPACGRDVIQTSDGGYAVVGWGYYLHWDDCYLYLINTDTRGNVIWPRGFSGDGNALGYSIRQTTDSGYIITGHIGRETSADDICLIKTDSLGIRQWFRTYGGHYSEYGYCVRPTWDGGYIISGFKGISSPSVDAYLLKTDSIGNPRWEQTFGGTGDDIAYGVCQTIDGGYILAGNLSTFTGQGTECYLVKVDSLGNQQWTKTVGGNSTDIAYSITPTSDGGCAVVGFTGSYGAGNSDFYLIRLENDCEQLSINLSPINPPIVIPVTGGSFQVTSIIDNLGLGAAVFDTWFNFSVPGIVNPISVLTRPNIILPPGGNLTRTLS